MARPRKVGLDYFPFECQNNEKIRLIQAEYGLKGFAIVVKLLQKIYGEFGYYCEWDEERSLLFASENGSSSDDRNLIEHVLTACIRRSIFSKDMFDKYSILTSSEIQENYLLGTSRREHVELKKEYLLIKCTQKYKNVYINPVNVYKNSIDVNNNTQSKVKESKVKESKVNKNIGAKEKIDLSCFSYDEKLNETFLEFAKMREKIKKPISTQHTVDLLVKKLKELCTVSGHMNNDKAIEVLNQSIMNNWQDLYGLKSNNNSSRSFNKHNQGGVIDWDKV